MVKPIYKHVLITRFNVRLFSGMENQSYNSPGWLDHRYRLFRNYCYPSVVNQTHQNFTWLVCFDHKLPETYRKINEILARDYAGFTPLYMERFSTDQLWPVINANPGKANVLVTSRLDNDDALHPSYMEIVQSKVVATENPYYINLLHGYNNNLNTQKVYKIKNYRTNPFLSFVEPLHPEYMGVYAIGHDSIRKSAFAKSILNVSETGWMICIHDMNVSNQSVGVRVGKKALRDFILPDTFSFREPDSLFSFLREKTQQRYKKSVYNFKVWVLRKLGKLN